MSLIAVRKFACILVFVHMVLSPAEAELNVSQDHIIQRGTMHRWSNPSKTKPARFVACALPCVPFDIAGEKLKEVHVPNKPASKL